MRKKVVVTGLGAICSLGENSTQIWQSILDRRIGYRVHEPEDKHVKAKFFGFLEPKKDRFQKFPRGLVRRISEFGRLALLAADEALAMSFGAASPTKTYSPFDCGVIIGTGWGGLDSANANHSEYLRTEFGSSHSTIMSMNNVGTATVSMHFGLKGYQSTPVAACASGAISIGEAAEAIRRGDAKCMVAGGSESLREIFNIWSIDVLEALTPEPSDPARACCPFDSRRSGFVLSEGAAVLCLEDYDTAVARGAKILAEISGYGNASDAHDFTAPAPDGGGRIQAIKRALANARIDPERIDYVNAHGTSTQLNDLSESNAIKETLGKWAHQTRISSTKSYTGHLIGAAGAIESIFCVKAIEQGVIPATLHLTDPDPRCDLNYTPNEHVAAKVDVCLNLSFGFGGANAALVINRI